MRTLAILATLTIFQACSAVEAYRIWTAKPEDGYAIGATREIPPPYRTLNQ